MLHHIRAFTIYRIITRVKVFKDYFSFPKKNPVSFLENLILNLNVPFWLKFLNLFKNS